MVPDIKAGAPDASKSSPLEILVLYGQQKVAGMRQRESV